MDLFDLYDKISRSIQFFQCNISGDTEGLLQICDEVRGENSQNQLNILFMGNKSINNEAFPKRFFDVKEELYLREECQDFPRYFKEKSKTKQFAYYVLQWNNENDKQNLINSTRDFVIQNNIHVVMYFIDSKDAGLTLADQNFLSNFPPDVFLYIVLENAPKVKNIVELPLNNKRSATVVSINSNKFFRFQNGLDVIYQSLRGKLPIPQRRTLRSVTKYDVKEKTIIAFSTLLLGSCGNAALVMLKDYLPEIIIKYTMKKDAFLLGGTQMAIYSAILAEYGAVNTKNLLLAFSGSAAAAYTTHSTFSRLYPISKNLITKFSTRFPLLSIPIKLIKGGVAFSGTLIIGLLLIWHLNKQMDNGNENINYISAVNDVMSNANYANFLLK